MRQWKRSHGFRILSLTATKLEVMITSYLNDKDKLFKVAKFIMLVLRLLIFLTLLYTSIYYAKYYDRDGGGMAAEGK